MAKPKLRKTPRPRKPKVKTAYYPAEDVQKIAETLIPECHGTLRDACIEYVFRTREDENQVIQPPRVQDAREWGRASAANIVDQRLHHLHFRVVVNGNWWEKASEEQRLAAVDHLLCHCWLTEGKPVIQQHDFGGFVAEIKRRGGWSKELAAFEAAMAQQELPLEPAGVPAGSEA